MARRQTDALIFDSLRLEGGLFVPAVLEKAARGDHTAQKASDYRLPKGLSLVDEQGRAFRIASALWKNFEATRARKDIAAARATIGFVTELLRDAFGYADFALCPEPITLADRAYPITAFASGGRMPVIIAPQTLELDEPDERFAIVDSGLRRRSAYQLTQQFLNASPACTWALITNGHQLRLVRDAKTLARPAFLEADLELILRDQRYADFAAVWRLFHASRAGAPGTSGDECVWETWKLEGQEQGERVRDGLRGGVTEALIALGTGFIEHRDNEALRLQLQTGDLSVGEYLQQLLRLIYRFLFLITVEERGLLHVSDDSPDVRRARDTYAQGYAFRRLRDRALRRAGFDRHYDLWTGVLVVFRGLANGEPRLALPALGGLFAPTQCPGLDFACLENRVFLTAMRNLRWSAASGQLSAIDYRNMDAEELGSVYESLLELVPAIDLPARRFGFVGLTDAGSTAGNARKTTGSYYTPDVLVQQLIKSALDPVIAQKITDHPSSPVEALLTLTVCDPSCGSGHFLLAAARRLAEKIAELRSSDGAIRTDDYRHALREVAGRCLFGVDLNPMAIELCRVALWLETVDPGKPMGFLNHHIRTGNSLLGTTPDLIAQGLPDEAFTCIEGDDKAACSELKKRNKNEREGFGPLFQQEEQSIRDRLRHAASAIEDMDDSQADLLQRKEAAFASTETAPEYCHAKLLADLWSAAFVIKKHYPGEANVAPNNTNYESQIAVSVAGHLIHAQDELFGQTLPTATPTKITKARTGPLKLDRGLPVGITTQHLRNFVQGKTLPADLKAEVEALASGYNFFHWHLAFPKVFDAGGFDVMLSNPPWERIKLQELEFFAARDPRIADAPNKAARTRLIKELIQNNPTLHAEFIAALHVAECVSKYLRYSDRFPLTAKGDINTYAIFSELILGLLNPLGRATFIVPTGIATDENSKEFFGKIIASQKLASLYDFENRGHLFSALHTKTKFCLFTISQEPVHEPSFCFLATQITDLGDPMQVFNLTAEDIKLIKPNTSTCPIFRTRSDAELTRKIYSRVPVLIREGSLGGNPWRVSFMRMFDMSNDSHLFRDSPGHGLLPLYEAKMFWHFDHRFTSYQGATQEHLNAGILPQLSPEQKQNSELGSTPRYWVEEMEYLNRVAPLTKDEQEARESVKIKGSELIRLQRDRAPKWLIGFRGITDSRNERTAIFSFLPPVAAGNSSPVMLTTGITPEMQLCLLGCLNTLVFDFVTRQKTGGTNFNFFIVQQLPVFQPSFYQPADILYVASRVLELVYTSNDMQLLADALRATGSPLAAIVPQKPYRWDETRRTLLRAELDAWFARAYGLSRNELRYILDPAEIFGPDFPGETFRVLKEKEITKFGEYRTRRLTLEAWDQLESVAQPSDGVSAVISVVIPAPTWLDQALVLPKTARGKLIPDRYRALLVPHLLYQAGGRLSFDRLRRAYWLLTEPSMLQRYATSAVDEAAKAWGKVFKDKLEKDKFIPHLRGAVLHDIHFIKVDGERWLELRRTENVVDDEHAVFDARLALLVADLWPASEPIVGFTQEEDAVIRELELVP